MRQSDSLIRSQFFEMSFFCCFFCCQIGHNTFVQEFVQFKKNSDSMLHAWDRIKCNKIEINCRIVLNNRRMHLTFGLIVFVCEKVNLQRKIIWKSHQFLFFFFLSFHHIFDCVRSHRHHEHNNNSLVTYIYLSIR